VLGHHWESAEGICIDIRTKGNADSGIKNRRWLMEIRCGNAEPFRVELGASGLGEDFKGPERGETCRMGCDVKRQKAKWDISDPALSWKADRYARAARLEAELKQKRQA
jgi:hypothetical protein